MVLLFDISGWDEKPWFSTGGTRAKKYLQNPEDGEYYYFKKSYKKEVLDYTYEFWSEIIASEVGKQLGFNMLEYHLAVIGEEIGCLCKSMIKSDEQELNEGGKYLTAYDSTFDPDDKTTRNQYSFQLIKNAFELFSLSGYTTTLIEMLIFDALIGNSDRHQENWAFITRVDRVSQVAVEKARKFFHPNYNKVPRWIKKVLFFPRKNKEYDKKIDHIVRLYFKNVEAFSPIYDNGSSLGRELTELRVKSMLRNEQELESYVCRGKSEIHWEGNKVSHFTLLENLMLAGYFKEVKNVIERSVKKFDTKKIETIIFEVDNLVPETLQRYKLPDTRKRLILKLINIRLKKLEDLIHERI